jgi:hypothetical protein
MQGSAPLTIEKLLSLGSKSHFPLFVIPIKIGSNLFRSMAFRIPFAETQEISCSLLLPPQMIATLDLLIRSQP